jgi:DNA-binding transcriptional regulator LsrR (DeoR family)
LRSGLIVASPQPLRRTAVQNLHSIEDAPLVGLCSRFIEGERPTDIADWLSKEIDDRVTREEVYPLLREAVRRRFFALLPPVSQVMSQRIADRFRGGEDQDRIHVASVSAESAREWLPYFAANLISKRIQKMGKRQDRVGIGLGGGGTIMRVAEFLGAQLQSAENLPRLGLHVLTSGFALDRPRSAPITFLSFFAHVPTKIECVGLFAPPVVDEEDYDRMKELPGIEESFRSAADIDLIVTSLASADDKDGELNEFLCTAGERTEGTLTALRNEGWVGDLLYHPYSSKGPITGVSPQVRTFSVSNLEDLKSFASDESKHVIVVCGPCGICGKTKAKALRPLLESEDLKVWTELVMDRTTAKELLEPPR